MDHAAEMQLWHPDPLLPPIPIFRLSEPHAKGKDTGLVLTVNCHGYDTLEIPP